MDIETRKLEGTKTKSRARWRLFGDTVSEEFFQATRAAPQSTSITELRDRNGDLLHERQALERVCTEFYANLYAQEILTPAQQLHLPITKDELYGTLKQMARGRSPGPDGVIVNFFLKFWDAIGDDYLAMIQSAITDGHLLVGMIAGTIILIFKAGEHENLSNWHPITLLNVSYKILAKVLQLRL